MKKFYYILFFLYILLQRETAQQLPQFSQFMLNPLAFNPAFSGSTEFAEARSNNRYQWTGITDAPRTYMLTCQGPFRKKHMGMGMHVYTDIVGPTRRIGFQASYAYHLVFKNDLRIGLGLSAGILQWGIDGHKLILREEGDRALQNVYQNTLVPDFGTGITVYKKDKFCFGISVPQIYEAPVQLYHKETQSRIVRHYHAFGLYNINLNEDIVLQPSFLIKYAAPAPVKIDGALRLLYKDFWIGGAYRSQDAMVAMMGYTWKNYLAIGYSYDFTTTNLKKYSAGTHEITFGIIFSRKQENRWKE